MMNGESSLAVFSDSLNILNADGIFAQHSREDLKLKRAVTLKFLPDRGSLLPCPKNSSTHYRPSGV